MPKLLNTQTISQIKVIFLSQAVTFLSWVSAVFSGWAWDGGVPAKKNGILSIKIFHFLHSAYNDFLKICENTNIQAYKLPQDLQLNVS